MSEPMSSGEIEDVLSSIRRLVSEDLRPGVRVNPGLAGSGLGGPMTTPPAGKLLLTPALRVITNGAPAVAPVTMAKKPQQEPSGAGATVSDPVGADTAAQAPSEAQSHPQSKMDILSQFPLQEGEDEWLPEAPSDADTDEASWEQSVMTRVVSEIGANMANPDEEWEPEAEPQAMASLSWQAPDWIEEAEVVEDSPEAAERDAVVRALADKAEAAAVAEIVARAAQAKADAAAQAEVQAKPKEAAPGDEDLFAEDDAYFDETVLRDLVRDLIREELSGALGERITRNVRKLVRAEVNRALTARDFE